MTRKEYERSVCSRRADAIMVPFVEVMLDGERPKIGDCHNNVDRWVKAHPNCQIVRGWITYITFGPAGVQLTAHSVVRDQHGKLFNITPVEKDQPRGTGFIEHHGDPDLFFAMKGHDIRCPSLDPEADAAALQAAIQAYGGLPVSDENCELPVIR